LRATAPFLEYQTMTVIREDELRRYDDLQRRAADLRGYL